MSSFDFKGLQNTEDGQLENEDKEIDFVLEQNSELERGNAKTPHRYLYRVISSGSLLKCVASASGLWSVSKRWRFISTLITMPLLVFVLIAEAVVVFYCKKNTGHFNDTFCHKTRGDLFDLSVDEYEVYQFPRFIAVAAQVCCFVAMSLSVRRSRYKSQVLSLEDAYKLVKPKKWVIVNFKMIGFLILLLTSNLLVFCCSSAKGTCDNCDPVGAVIFSLWSVVLWLTVIACLVYATVINGIIAQAHQANEQIVEMEGGTVNDAIEIHQYFCKIGMRTIKVYHTWFLLNSACYFWLIVYVVVVFLTQSSHMHSWFSFYHVSVCGLYSVFAFVHPWLAAASLTRTYSKLTRKLNTNLQWKPNHPFCDRSKFDSFLLYASNTQCQFSQITCSSSLPYISLFLALCGLGLKFFQ